MTDNQPDMPGEIYAAHFNKRIGLEEIISHTKKHKRKGSVRYVLPIAKGECRKEFEKWFFACRDEYRKNGILIDDNDANSMWLGFSAACERADLSRPEPSDAATDKKQHPDDQAVDRLADAMKAKLAKKRQDGKSGWDDPFICSDDFLNECMMAHIAKGDPVDVANFCMMLFERGEKTRLVSQIRGNPEDNTHSLSKLDDKAPDQSEVIKALVEALKSAEQFRGALQGFIVEGKASVPDDLQYAMASYQDEFTQALALAEKEDK